MSRSVVEWSPCGGQSCAQCSVWRQAQASKTHWKTRLPEVRKCMCFQNSLSTRSTFFAILSKRNDFQNFCNQHSVLTLHMFFSSFAEWCEGTKNNKNKRKKKKTMHVYYWAISFSQATIIIFFFFFGIILLFMLKKRRKVL